MNTYVNALEQEIICLILLQKSSCLQDENPQICLHNLITINKDNERDLKYLLTKKEVNHELKMVLLLIKSSNLQHLTNTFITAIT